MALLDVLRNKIRELDPTLNPDDVLSCFGYEVDGEFEPIIQHKERIWADMSPGEFREKFKELL